MGYDIYIGNAELNYSQEDDYIAVHVKEVELETAPAFENDTLSAHCNNRHPSYSGWSGFVKRVGLEAFFQDTETGRMREHSGIFPLCEDHYAIIKAALEKHRASLPDDIQPGFIDDSPILKEDGTFERWATKEEYEERRLASKTDADLARLLWLEWWVRWALDNCQYPAIYNF